MHPHTPEYLRTLTVAQLLEPSGLHEDNYLRLRETRLLGAAFVAVIEAHSVVIRGRRYITSEGREVWNAYYAKLDGE